MHLLEIFNLKQHVIGSTNTIDHTLDQSLFFVVFTVAVTVTNVEVFYWSVKTNTKLFINKCYINASTADTFITEFSEYTLLVLSSCDEILDNVCDAVEQIIDHCTCQSKFPGNSSLKKLWNGRDGKKNLPENWEKIYIF